MSSLSFDANIGTIVTVVAALECLVLAGLALARAPRRLAQWSFTLGMLGFGAEATATFGLLNLSSSPSSHHVWSTALRVFGLLVAFPWGLFAFTSARSAEAPIPRGWKVGFGMCGTVLLGGAVAALIWPFFAFPPSGEFVGGQATPAGRVGLVIELLATLGVLYGLEPSIRNSWGVTRWRLKYLVLGLGGVFLVRLYLLSQMLLFQVELPVYLLTKAATLAVGDILIGTSLWRTESLRVDLRVSRHFVYRSVVVGVAGVYLVAVGLAAWVVRSLGVPEIMFWGSLIIFVSALGMTALLFSENLRWRIKRYISTHFYPSKYDYREQWRTFSSRTSSRVTLETLVPELVRTVGEAVGAPRTALYLVDERDGRFHLAGAVGAGEPPKTLAAEIDAFPKTAGGRDIIIVGQWAYRRRTGRHEEAAAALTAQVAGGDVELAIPLARQDRLIGILLVGKERAGNPYTPEDLELLTVFGEQAAGAVASAQLSEKLTQSRAFEAFHRLTSFVVHDLKNSISALSMLSQNALEHFDDPEFQRDTTKTLSWTVDRMKALLAKLSATPEVQTPRFEEVNLPELVQGVAAPLLARKQVTLVSDLWPVPPILGDSEALERVFQNLIKNAVEAMNGNGELSVSTGIREGKVVCSVTDNGRGMSEEYIRKSLFVPFQSTKKGGWGIGLYQVKEIVEAHGGRIEVESQEGRGTSFRLVLPPAPSEALAQAGRSSGTNVEYRITNVE